MTYREHMKVNFKVVVKCMNTIGNQILLAGFHLAHGVIPVKLTSHTYWRFHPHK